jgi:hypothetical protein
LGIAVALGALAGIGLLLPSHYHVERRIYVGVPPTAVFGQINTLPHWLNWAFAGYTQQGQVPPVEFMGPMDGPGALYVWRDEAGEEGRVEIVASTPPEQVQLRMLTNNGAFSSRLTFVLEPQLDGTIVHWIEEGDVGYRLQMRYLMLFHGLDAVLGKRYEAGLQALKAYCESHH